MDKSKIGKILWTDLTVKNAEEVSRFYEAVVGWKKDEHDMGTYKDYVMKNPAGTEAVAGVCHAQGVNDSLPPQWLPYVIVDHLDESIKLCEELGGKVIGEKREMGGGHYCLIQDPAGAYMMICG